MESGKYVARLIRSTIRDTTELVDTIVDSAATRPLGSGIQRMQEWIDAQARRDFFSYIFNQSVGASERTLRSSAEMAASIAILLESDSTLMVSPHVLARAVGEGIMRICYVADPAVTPPQTLLRMAAFELATHEGNFSTMRAFGDREKDELESLRGNITLMHRWLTDSGIARTPARREPFSTSLSLEGHVENISFNATAAYERYMPASAWSYNLGSGATHSRGWMLPSLVGTIEEDALATPADSAATIGHIILDVADALARIGAGHAGIAVDAFLRATHLRRNGIVRMGGRGSDISLNYAEYASRFVGPNEPLDGDGSAFRRSP